MSDIRIRPAVIDDLEGLLTIYNWAVAHTTATMDTDPRSHAGQIDWLEAHNGNPYPAIVAERDGIIVGYASLSPYNRRLGYRTTAEVSVYVHPEWHRQGIGKALLAGLLDKVKEGDFVSLVSLITADNEASLRLHEQYGFEHVGTLTKVGRKFNQWVDVTFMQFIVTTD